MLLDAACTEVKKWQTDEGATQPYAQERKEIIKLTHRLAANKEINQQSTENRLDVFEMQAFQNVSHSCPYL
jgi:hypothetical protein